MTLRIIDSHKNIGEILNENINKNYKHVIFLDWDDTVISTSSLNNHKFEFRNQREKFDIIETFKAFYINDSCLALYILTYRQNPYDVQGEATELKIMEYLKSDYKCRRTDTYNRIGPIISVDYGCPKINVIQEIINEDFNKITNNVFLYFVDDNYKNIVGCLLSSKYEDNMFIYFFPDSNEDLTISRNINKKAKEILKYLK